MKTVLHIAAAAITLPLAANIETGDNIPELDVQTQENEQIALQEQGQQGYLLVFFYPRAGTSGCTAQACSLRDAYEQLQQHGVEVIGVSTDSVEDQLQFAENQNLPYTLLADTEGDVAEAFGVPVRAGMAGRQAFLFHQGELVWLDRSASTRQQAQDILNYLEENHSSE